MLELTGMPERGTASDENTTKVVKVRLKVTKQEARKLSRVVRWEKKSESTSLELTGRD